MIDPYARKDSLTLWFETQEIIKRHKERCIECGGHMEQYGAPQMAHLIAQGKTNYSRFGAAIIEHPLNRVPTCCLYCNGRQNIGNNPGKCRALLEDIRAASPDLSEHIDGIIARQRLPEYDPAA